MCLEEKEPDQELLRNEVEETQQPPIVAGEKRNAQSGRLLLFRTSWGWEVSTLEEVVEDEVWIKRKPDTFGLGFEIFCDIKMKIVANNSTSRHEAREGVFG